MSKLEKVLATLAALIVGAVLYVVGHFVIKFW